MGGTHVSLLITGSSERRARWVTASLMMVSLALVAAVAAPVPEASATTATKAGTITRQLAGVFVGGGTREAFSSPTFADVTGDGRPELITAGLDGRVEAYTMPGRGRLWSTHIGNSAIQATPAVANVAGDARNDLVVATMDGRVIILDGPSGLPQRTFSQGPPQHCPVGTDCRPDGFFATPAVADINSDGVLDIIAPSWDHSVYAWSVDGRLLWRRFLEDTLWSSPAVADIDRNGTLEIILGGDIYAGNQLGVPGGGLVWVLRADGSVYPGYPISIPGQTVWSSPAVGDLNSDGWPDVVVGTGTNFADPAGRQVHAFTAANRTNLTGWPVGVDGRAMGSPAIANLDNDGQLEVVTTSEGGHVYAFDTNGTRRWRCAGCAGAHSSVTVADVDRDGQQEVISAGDHELRTLSGASGTVETSVALTGGGWAPAIAPAVSEIDGKVLIAVSKSDVNLSIDLVSTGQPLCSADWPAFRQGSLRQGRSSGANTLLWAPFACPSDFVAQQYQDFLGRKLDAAGASYWSNQLRAGRPGAAIVESFMNSPEFGKVMAPVVRASFTLTGTYPRSASQVRSGADALRKGRTIAAVMDEMIKGSSLSGTSDSAFIDTIYRNLYGRTPTAAERTVELQRLTKGESRGTVAAGHSEFAAGRLAAQVNVTMTYLGMLNRTPDSGGFSYWVPQARSGNLINLITGFQRSPEYRGRVT